MDKKTKELLKRTLSMTDDKQLLKFAKNYAAKDQAFAEAIIEKFLPAESTLDLEKMVNDCFLHKKKGGRRRYGPSLDWTTIRRDIKRLLKQLDYLRQHQDSETAAEGALLLLETLAEKFECDNVYEDYNYGNSNFGNEEALSLVSEVLLNSRQMAQSTKSDYLQRLEVLASSDTYKNYLTCGISKVVDTLKQHLLPPDEQLKDVDKNIRAAKYDSDQSYYVKWKVRLLRELGRDDEAEKVITQYLNLDDVAALRYDQLVADSRFEEAKAFCKMRIDSGTGNWSNTQSWRERLLELAQQINDVETTRETTKWLFAHGNVTQDDKKEFYRICRETFETANWPAYRDMMFAEGAEGNASEDTILQLYAEEQLYNRMYLYLQKLPDTFPYYPSSFYSNSGGERLCLFSRYARFLTEEQCQTLVSDFAQTILDDSRIANDRDRYRQIASRLHLLSQSCEEGRRKARALADQILRENPKKPAYQQEISQYDD